MNHANERGSADWIQRVLATVSQHLGAGDPAAVARLASALGQAPWWDGCPSAAEWLPAIEAGAGYGRFPLQHLAPAGCSALLIAWPPGYSTPIHDHDGLWGIELVLDGVLEVEAFSLSVEPELRLVSKGVTVLGLGDHAVFSDSDYAHRCRNLSARLPALSLHVYGGELDAFRAFDKDADGRWESVEQRVRRDTALV